MVMVPLTVIICLQTPILDDMLFDQLHNITFLHDLRHCK